MVKLFAIAIFIFSYSNVNAQKKHLRFTAKDSLSALQFHICEDNIIASPAVGIGNKPSMQWYGFGYFLKLSSTEDLLQMLNAKCAALKVYGYMGLAYKKYSALDSIKNILDKDSSAAIALSGCIATNTTISKIINTTENWYIESEIAKLLSNIVHDTLYRKDLFSGIKNSKYINENVDRSKFKFDGGIYFEVFDSTNENENRYTDNNLIFKANKKFVYDYSYYKNYKSYFFELTGESNLDNSKKWQFVEADKKSKNSIIQIIMDVKYGLQGFDKMIKGYNQSIIQYKYLTSTDTLTDSEHTGLVENSLNIWFHPPRMMLFKILELNPFPFVQLPYNKNKTWEWNLDIGDIWGDSRWEKWSGIVKTKYQYQFNKKVRISTKFGKLDCVQTIAIGKSRLGTTKLISYFNVELGFVKMEYINIDKSIIRFELSKILN
jgi:hypothetical protein